MKLKFWPEFFSHWFWPSFRREIRASFKSLSLASLTLCVGMIALTSVLLANERLESQAQQQADVLLGGDVELSDVRLLPENLIKKIQTTKKIIRTSHLTSLFTLAGLPQDTRPRLVEVLAIEASFPLVPGMNVNPKSSYDQLKRGGLWIEKGFAETHALQSANLNRNQTLDDKQAKKLWNEKRAIRIGKKIFPILGIVENDQMRDFASLSLSARLYISRDVALQQKLISAQSRLRDRLLIQFSKTDDLKKETQRLKQEINQFEGSKLSLRSKDDALSAAFKPARSLFLFFNAIGFTALLLLGLGSAQSVHSYLERKKYDAHIMSLLGAPWTQIKILFIGNSVLILLLTLFLGAWWGSVLFEQQIAPRLESFFPNPTNDIHLTTRPLFIFKFALSSILLTFSFIFPGARAFSRQEKSNIKEQEFEFSPQDISRHKIKESFKKIIKMKILWGTSDFAWLATALILAFTVSNETVLNLSLVLILTTLYVIVKSIVAFLSRLGLSPHLRLPLSVRLAVSEISARPAQSSLTLLLFSLSICLLAFIFDIRSNILRQINANSLSEKRPNLFVLDAPEGAVPSIEKIISKGSPESKIISERIVRARLQRINDSAAEKWLEQWDKSSEERRRAERLFNREQNLTSRAELQTENENETLVEGKFWTKGSARESKEEVSVEAALAKDLKIQLGDRLTFDIQGVPITARVTSFRRVRWQNFRPNFFFVFHPSVLAEAPFNGLVATHVADKKKRVAILNSLFNQHPGMTTLDATDLAQLVERLFTSVVDILRFLTTLLFIGALFNTMLGAWTSFSARAKNFSLYRCLGANNTTVLWSILNEFLILSSVGTVVGLTGRWMLGSLIEKSLLSLDDQLSVMNIMSLAIPMAVVILCIAVALISAVVILKQAPFRVLRRS